MKTRWLTVFLAVMVVLGLALAACDGGTITKTVDLPPGVAPEYTDVTLQTFINGKGGALFQDWGNRSFRFFVDGGYQSFAIGLGPSQTAATQVGERYIIGTWTDTAVTPNVTHDAIMFYRPADTDDADPGWIMLYTFDTMYNLTFTRVVRGAAGAAVPTAANFPVNLPLSYGKIPYYRP